MRMVKDVLLNIAALGAIVLLLVILPLMEFFLDIEWWCLTNLNKKGQNKKDG